MLAVLTRELEGADVLAMAAAVADFQAANPRDEKMKKGDSGLELQMQPAPDLLQETRQQRTDGSVFTLGFALETEEGEANAIRKLRDKAMDMVALNRADEPGSGFDVTTNRVTLIDRDEAIEELPLMSKEEVADQLLDRIEARLRG